MSDNIPFEIQAKIINSLPVKSLIQFRSVCKPWKSLIDSSRFIARYSGQHAQMQRLLVTYYDPADLETKYVSIADDETFSQQKVSYSDSLLASLIESCGIIGSSHGLFCMYGEDPVSKTDRAVIWNPSIRKAVGVVVPNVPTGMTYGFVVGFGVCPETTDAKIVKIRQISWGEDLKSLPDSIPWQVEVFTLSTGAWRRPHSGSLPRKSIHFDLDSVVVDGVLYWRAIDRVTVDDDGGWNYYNLVMSFDMTTEEFKEIYLPDSLAHVDEYNLSLSKLRNSLVINYNLDDAGFSVWMMLDGVPNMFMDGFPNSFVRIFTVKSPDLSVRGYRKTGELIIEFVEHLSGQRDVSSLIVYDPYSKHINNLGMDVYARSFSVYPYIETLLLHDQLDGAVYDEGKATLQSGEPRAESP